jgi:hypothetical protein
VFVYNFSNDLKLIICISFNVSLQSFLSNDLIRETFNLDLDLERITFKDHQLIPKVGGVLIDRDPDRHGVILQLTIHLIHI